MPTDYLGDYRTKLRRSLKDEDATNYRWTNDELDRQIARAVKDYSLASPVEAKATIATTSASRDISMSTLTDVVRINLVEFPVGKFPPLYQPFSVCQTTLTMQGDYAGDGTNAYIFYGQLHTLSAGTNTIPSKDEEVVLLGAQASALAQYAAYAINRVNVGGDYPPKDAARWSQKLFDDFRKELRKVKSKVRVTRGYQPYHASESKRSDYGP